MKSIRFISLFTFCFALAGCRSHVVKVNLTNSSDAVVKTIIVDYPTATFGKDELSPGETFSYAIKPLETGMIKIQFTDAQGSIHTYRGTTLHKNDEGSLEIKFSQANATVLASLH